MADEIKLDVNGELKTVEAKPLTLIFHKGNVNVKPAEHDMVVIEPSSTVACADKLTHEEWSLLRKFAPFVDEWKCVFPETEPPANLKNEGLGYRHVVGLILLVHRVMASGCRPYVRFPETYLHPSAQLGLADLFLKFQGN